MRKDGKNPSWWSPAIDDFIYTNYSLSAVKLSKALKKEFNADVSHNSLQPFVNKAKESAKINNEARIEEVRQKQIDKLADEITDELTEYVRVLHRFRDCVDIVFDRAMEQDDMKIAYPTSRVFEVYSDSVLKYNQMLSNMKNDSKVSLTVDEAEGKVSLIDLLRAETED